MPRSSSVDWVYVVILFAFAGRGKETPLSVYMVFPYMDHDLAGLLENERVKLIPSQIKLYMKQLLEGTEYMHRVWKRIMILHPV